MAKKKKERWPVGLEGMRGAWGTGNILALSLDDNYTDVFTMLNSLT